MGKSKRWKLNGPRQDRFTLLEVAALLGYEDAQSIRALVREGRLPSPRGIGTNQYYTGLDVAIIVEMFGRWQPLVERPAKANENASNRAKANESERSRESQN